MSDASGDHMVETYSSMGLVMALYVAMIVSFCFLHVVDVGALSICIGVESQSEYFWIHDHGEYDFVYL